MTTERRLFSLWKSLGRELPGAATILEEILAEVFFRRGFGF